MNRPQHQSINKSVSQSSCSSWQLLGVEHILCPCNNSRSIVLLDTEGQRSFQNSRRLMRVVIINIRHTYSILLRLIAPTLPRAALHVVPRIISSEFSSPDEFICCSHGRRDDKSSREDSIASGQLQLIVIVLLPID